MIADHEGAASRKREHGRLSEAISVFSNMEAVQQDLFDDQPLGMCQLLVHSKSHIAEHNQ